MSGKSLLAALVVTVIVAFGCADSSKVPVRPSIETRPQPEFTPVSQTVLVPASGGQVSAGSASLVLPAGALGQVTEITLAGASQESAEIWTVSPQGLALDAAASLSLPLPSACSPGTHRILGWDATSNSWVDLGGVESSGVVTTSLSDFSRYQIDIIE